ncbi:MAG TPA: zf-HC2 domain-containing protein [Gemmatimonadaceae bacterium]|jgi:hypothetical protein
MNEFDHQHIHSDRLGDWVDGRITGDEARDIERHLAACASCARQRERLVDLIAEARSLPASIDPPAQLWNAVRGHIATTAPVKPLGGTRRWQLAAAAVLLVALSSGVTALLIRHRSEIVAGREALATHASTAIQPAAARAVARDYEATIRQLRETLDERRAQLDPATIAKVEASLRVVDSAIAEARGALADDPANLTLVDLLAASYERKLELLRRASELSSSI